MLVCRIVVRDMRFGLIRLCKSEVLAFWLLVLVGLAASFLVHPLATGAEELVRWQTIVFSNKTSMFFLVLGMIGLLGGIYYGRAKTPRGKALVAIATSTIYLLVGWRISLLSPFDIALNYGG